MFCRSLLVLLYFFYWPLYCLFFFDIWILITPLVSSNSSCDTDISCKCQFVNIINQIKDIKTKEVILYNHKPCTIISLCWVPLEFQWNLKNWIFHHYRLLHYTSVLTSSVLYVLLYFIRVLQNPYVIHTTSWVASVTGTLKPVLTADGIEKEVSWRIWQTQQYNAAC
jgi:hypothetical protein